LVSRGQIPFSTMWRWHIKGVVSPLPTLDMAYQPPR
jgi:hypothetical protein